MAMTEKAFRKYLALYGASIKNWPDDIQAEAVQVVHRPDIRALVIEQRYFEEALRDNDVISPANPWFADRIINAAGKKSSGINIAAWLQELLAAVMPQPAFALATVLTLGIVIGFSLPSGYGEDNVRSLYAEDAGL